MMSEQKQHARGCCAPELTNQILDQYDVLAGEIDDQATADSYSQLLQMCREFLKSPKSDLPAEGEGLQRRIPLEEAEVKRMWALVPWQHECEAMVPLFERLTGPVRDAAHHLLWYACELTHDREPLTKEMA